MGQEKYDDLMQIDNIVGFEDLQICENNMGSGTFPVLTADSTQDDDSSDYAILSGVVDYKDSIIDFKDYGVAVYNDSGYLEDENHVALSNSTLIAVNLLVGYDAKVIVRDSSLLEINQTSSNKGAILIGGGC